jgi:hypothetical protein
MSVGHRDYDDCGEVDLNAMGCQKGRWWVVKE